MTFEELRKANSTIATTDVKGKQYAEVNQRIKAFRMVYPNGSIQTEIVSLENGIVTMRAFIYSGEDKIIGTGYAQEKEGSTFINKTSFIENCETSAVGRALGMCGFGIDTSVASAEEVLNAINNQNQAAQFQNAEDELPFPEVEKVYCCENCGEVFKTLHAPSGDFSPKEIYERSKRANGKALCKTCVEALKKSNIPESEKSEQQMPNFLK